MCPDAPKYPVDFSRCRVRKYPRGTCKAARTIIEPPHRTSRNSGTALKNMGCNGTCLWKVLAGFAGSTADALTLFEKFEAKLEQYKGNLPRAAVELAKDWRTDRYLRRLEALLAVMDNKNSFIISGNGDVIEPDDGIVAIGSGGSYATAAARMLVKYSNLSAREIINEALNVAADICIFTNKNITIEEL